MKTLPLSHTGQPEHDSLLEMPNFAAPLAQFDDDDTDTQDDDMDGFDDEDFDEFDEEGDGLGTDDTDEFGDDEDFFEEEGEEMEFEEEEDEDEQ